MSKGLRVPDYLAHILKAIERIDRYTTTLARLDMLLILFRVMLSPPVNGHHRRANHRQKGDAQQSHDLTAHPAPHETPRKRQITATIF